MLDIVSFQMSTSMFIPYKQCYVCNFQGKELHWYCHLAKLPLISFRVLIWRISDYIKFCGLYILKPYTKNRLSIILKLGLGGICISILLRVVHGVSLLEPGTIVTGFLLGVVVGIFELFLFSIVNRR